MRWGPGRPGADAREARQAEGQRLWWANRALHSLVQALARSACAQHFLEPVADILLYYRQLVAEHHPDRLIAKGVPEELIGVATARMAAINHAYGQITKTRVLAAPEGAPS